MKTRLLSLLAILFMGLTFVGCSSDDDDGNSSAGIVGTWRYDDDEGHIIFTFKSDESGSLKIETDEVSVETRFSYSYNHDDQTITTYSNDEGVDYYRIDFHANKTLILYSNSLGKLTLTKQ